MTRIGFITGLKKEATILCENANISISDIYCAGAKAGNAYHKAQLLVQNGCELLISFGVAGALDPTLKAGDLILPASVINKDGEVFETDFSRHQKMTSHLADEINFFDGRLFGSEKLISSIPEKKHLNQSFGAVAVDMESLGVAQAALEQGCPFLIVRTISDTANQNIPAATFRAVDEEGNIQIAKVLKDLALRPADLPSLIKLAGNSQKAFASLCRVAALGFGL